MTRLYIAANSESTISSLSRTVLCVIERRNTDILLKRYP